MQSRAMEGAPPQATDEERTALSVFISYSRTDTAFANEIVEGLHYDGAFNILIDSEGIHVGEAWQARLGSLIAAADCVAFLLSKRSAVSEVCRWEVDHAVSLGKRIVPVLVEETPNEMVPSALSKLHYVRFDGGRSFMSGLSGLRRALRADLGWIREHTRLLGRALEWQESGRNPNRLLTGSDITAAREWLDRVPADAPPPSELHRDLIFVSEQADTVRKSDERKRAEALQVQVKKTRRALAAVAAFAVLALGVGGVAALLWREAEAERARAVDLQKTAQTSQRNAEAATKTATSALGRAETAESKAKTAAGVALQQEEVAKREAAAARLAEEKATGALTLKEEAEASLQQELEATAKMLIAIVGRLPSSWPSDAKSIDYAHLAESPLAKSLRGQTFSLTKSSIDELLSLNSFVPTTLQGKYLLALRGAELASGTIAQPAQSLSLRDIRPDHKRMRCLVIVVDTTTGTLTPFLAATVPSDVQMRQQFSLQRERPATSMIATGNYAAGFKTLRRSQPWPSVIDFRIAPVLRTFDDLVYTVEDSTWTLDKSVGHSIHAGGINATSLRRIVNSVGRSTGLFVAEELEDTIDFSSAGSVEVSGRWRQQERRYSGQFESMRQALGLSSDFGTDPIPITPEADKRIGVVLLTGLDAALASSSSRASGGEDLHRLRFGSSGPLVDRLKRQLQLTPDGAFDREAIAALLEKQRTTLGWADGVYAPRMDQALGLCVLGPSCGQP